MQALSQPPIPIVHLATVGSTNDEALRLAREQAEVGPIACRADAQTAGRGRRGARWDSRRGGLWLSLAWPWDGGPSLAPLGMLVAIAAREALVEHLDASLSSKLMVKWPNDLLVEADKLGGVLCERPDPTWLVIGLGINLVNAIEGGAPGERSRTSLLACCGVRADPAAMATPVLERVAAWLRAYADDPARTLAQAHTVLDSALAYRGVVVGVRPTEEGAIRTGRVVGLTEDLRLLLEYDGHRYIYGSGQLISDGIRT